MESKANKLRIQRPGADARDSKTNRGYLGNKNRGDTPRHEQLSNFCELSGR
jgi:hypothetical protein